VCVWCVQVWFQNRRSKERRMKQLSALGVRRQFYRNPRRLRALRPGEELDGADLLGQHGFNYFVGQSPILLHCDACCDLVGRRVDGI